MLQGAGVLVAKLYLQFTSLSPKDSEEVLDPDSPISDVPPISSHDLLKLLVMLNKHLTPEERLYISQHVLPVCQQKYVCLASQMLDRTLCQLRQGALRKQEDLDVNSIIDAVADLIPATSLISK